MLCSTLGHSTLTERLALDVVWLTFDHLLQVSWI